MFDESFVVNPRVWPQRTSHHRLQTVLVCVNSIWHNPADGATFIESQRNTSITSAYATSLRWVEQIADGCGGDSCWVGRNVLLLWGCSGSDTITEGLSVGTCPR